MYAFDCFAYVFCPVMAFCLTCRNIQIVRTIFRNGVTSRWAIGGMFVFYSIVPGMILVVPVFKFFDFDLSPKVIFYMLLGYVILFALLLFIVAFIQMKELTDESNKPLQ